ncbi:DEAD/DEAH box helicase family protein [Pseudoalteromonas undina]|uniref:DEAD/DEAH box helicase family protein n=1 Tax=Pseudoalteromonas undina TaxID=43660 RepID=A0ACC6R976_9GAMM
MNSFSEHQHLQSNNQQLITGDNDPLLPNLVHAINNATEIEITVSFIQPSGLALLFDPLSEALQSGATLKLLTSDYLDITHPNALRELMALVDRGADVRIYQTHSNQSFHMKSYIFVKTNDQNEITDGCAFIGSSNISASALTKGHEWNFRHDYTQPKTSQAAKQFLSIRTAFENIFNHELVTHLSHEWINSYITRRKTQQFVSVNHADTAEQVIEKNEAKTPRPAQIEALNALAQTRTEGFKRGLVVLATGMGKTWLSAFDVKQFKAKRILFVAHREEILLQAQRTFSELLTLSTGFYNGKQRDKNAECLFASIQTIGRSNHLKQFAPTAFDYIIVDEFHHASARVYRQLLNYFEPQFLLGLTATPERTDQADILGLCDNNLVFERNLTQGIDQKTLVPFHYYGIWDENVNYQAIPWRNGRFDPAALENKFATQKRADHALLQWQQYKQQRTLGFCISTKHADYMADAFNKAGVKALSVHSQSKVRRNDALKQLEQRQVEVLFTVDLFNEGTDLPSIDTILMLRPSDSKILFLQQLGRGLRTLEGKTHLVVLDFIGNHHSFLNKPYALLHETTPTGVVKKLKKPNLADGCFINIDLKVTDFWQQLAKAQRTTALEDITQLAEQLGHLPTLSEFYYHYGDIKKVNSNYTSWFDLIAQTQNIDDEAQQSAKQLAPFYDFLHKGIQTTSMTKCFKAILLEAYVALNGFAKPPTVAELAAMSAKVLARHPNLKQHDLPIKEQQAAANSQTWQSYWRKNPIKAYTNKNKDGTQWFTLQNDTVKATFDVPAEKCELLNNAVLELVEYTLAKYSQRLKVKTPTTKQNTEQNADNVTQLAFKDLADTVKEQDNALKLPYFPNIKIACGHFKTGDESDMELMDAPLGADKLDPNVHFLARASGNSMNGGKHPILDGDLLLLELITSDRAGSLRGQIVAIERDDISGDGQYLLRKVNKLPNGQYELIAQNPDYEVMIADESMRTFARFKQVVAVAL